MTIATVTEWWDRYGILTKMNKINEIIAAINANTQKTSIVAKNCAMYAYDGAIMTSYGQGGLSVYLDNTGEDCRFEGAPIHPDEKRTEARIKVYYYSSGADMTVTARLTYCDQSNRELVDATIPLGVNEKACYTSDWVTITDLDNQHQLRGHVEQANAGWIHVLNVSGEYK